MNRVVILTSAHPVLDKRIFHRHAKLVRDAGFEVHLIAPEVREPYEVEGIRIHGFAPPRGYRQRLQRHQEIFRIAHELKGDLYHLHDPDLLWVGRRLQKSLGAPVVYDAHEDFPFAARTSRGFGAAAGTVIGAAVDLVERTLARKMDGVVCPHRLRLNELGRSDSSAIFLPNYPPRDVYDVSEPSGSRERRVVYSGLLTRERGAYFILDAAARMPDVHFLLLAKFIRDAEQRAYEVELARRALPNVDFHGFVPFAEVPQQLMRAGVGIMPWARTPQHLRAAQPSKLYEYMACYLPVVATDLPITREVVDETGCGLLHADSDVEAFARSVYAILDDPSLASQMAVKGRRAFEERFSYEVAGESLLRLYSQLMDSSSRSQVAAL